MEKFKVYKHETVTSVTEIEAESAEHALKFARVAQGTASAPEYTEVARRPQAMSLSETIERKPRTKKTGSAE